MSMLTGQADELRKAALIQEEHTRYDMTLLLTNATDTIRSLRYRVRELRAKNAKLRDENSRLRKYISKALSTISYCDCCLYVDCGCDTETMPMHEGCKAFEELRELGVEVIE